MDLPEFLINVEELIEGSRTGRKRLESMQKNLAAIAEARSRLPIKSRAKKASLSKT